ncbi:glycosyltransferase family 15 protein [Tortispora caseinolytica NRRL Y-17796]|uniref:Glycosyltransferase family 15 protein n=1 Tax=Tortispora caseinolytica NRRL Y-17796 TaxID=767744 RepID=A0A1E4TBW4_9ASCO|nr:glycosyltransferase family 15 protein [Tortispora caseinolytica NRRL Y-17796]
MKTPYGEIYSGKNVQTGQENACLVMLARNSELDHCLQSIREQEDTFNKQYHYPWLFLNDEEYTEEFKSKILDAVSGEARFGLIDPEHWTIPDWIDTKQVYENLKTANSRNILYGALLSYRHMCRYNSGFFYKHPMLLEYDWYWRVEPDVHFWCDVEYDVFTYMKNNNYTYGFTMTAHEYMETIPTLFESTIEFFLNHTDYLDPNSAYKFLGDIDSNIEYNACHFWSNFEIGDLHFYRNKMYQDYFEFLDQKGGFFYERWGDAPVHTLAVALMMPRSRIHHFADMGYYHSPYTRCPTDLESYKSGRCRCIVNDHNFDDDGYSCNKLWLDLYGRTTGSETSTADQLNERNEIAQLNRDLKAMNEEEKLP